MIDGRALFGGDDGVDGWHMCCAEIVAWFVTAPMPAAHANVSKQVPLKFVSPPKPFQRATGTTASKPARSARVTISRLFGQFISRRPGAVVAAQPLLTLTPKTPSFRRLSL